MRLKHIPNCKISFSYKRSNRKCAFLNKFSTKCNVICRYTYRTAHVKQSLRQSLLMMTCVSTKACKIFLLDGALVFFLILKQVGIQISNRRQPASQPTCHLQLFGSLFHFVKRQYVHHIKRAKSALIRKL